jgi:hypothetical protein
MTSAIRIGFVCTSVQAISSVPPLSAMKRFATCLAMLVAPARQLEVPVASSKLQLQVVPGAALTEQILHFNKLVAFSSAKHHSSSVLHA